MTGGPILSTPLVLDNPDYTGLETVVGSGDGKLYMVRANGAQAWQRDTGSTIESSALAMKLDGDAYYEIIIGNNAGDLLAYHDYGDPYTLGGWPVSAADAISAPPVIADADQDTVLDIMVASEDAKVHAIQANGSVVSGWPVTTTFAVQDAIPWAIDGDAQNEIVGPIWRQHSHLGVEMHQPRPTNTPTPTRRQHQRQPKPLHLSLMNATTVSNSRSSVTPTQTPAATPQSLVIQPQPQGLKS